MPPAIGEPVIAGHIVSGDHEHEVIFGIDPNDRTQVSTVSGLPLKHERSILTTKSIARPTNDFDRFALGHSMLRAVWQSSVWILVESKFHCPIYSTFRNTK